MSMTCELTRRLRWPASLLKWAELTELPKRMTAEHGGGFKEFTLQNAGFFEGFEDKDSFLTNQVSEAAAAAATAGPNSRRLLAEISPADVNG